MRTSESLSTVVLTNTARGLGARCSPPNRHTRYSPIGIVILSIASAFPDPDWNLCPQYKAGKTLGTGRYNTVKEVVDTRTGTYYACKVTNKKLMQSESSVVDSFFPTHQPLCRPPINSSSDQE